MGPDEVTRSVGMRIRALRKTRGLSQERLAFQAGMDRTAIGKIERGERGVTLQTLFRLCGALRTSMSRLLEGL